jgi:hypothetical protein
LELGTLTSEEAQRIVVKGYDREDDETLEEQEEKPSIERRGHRRTRSRRRSKEGSGGLSLSTSS